MTTLKTMKIILMALTYLTLGYMIGLMLVNTMSIPRKLLQKESESDVPLQNKTRSHPLTWLKQFKTHIPSTRHAERSTILGRPSYFHKLSLTDIVNTTHGFFVNIGASDGCWLHRPNPEHCDEANVLLDKGWSGLLIDGNGQTLQALQQSYPVIEQGPVTRRYVVAIVTLENLLKLLDGIPHAPDVFKIDIDHNDCSLLLHTLAAGYRPRVLLVEYNVLFPPPIYYNWPHSNWPYSTTVKCADECSLQFLVDMVRPYGYTLLQVDYWDAYFVHNDLLRLPAWQAPLPTDWWWGVGFRGHHDMEEVIRASAYKPFIHMILEAKRDKADILQAARSHLDICFGGDKPQYELGYKGE